MLTPPKQRLAELYLSAPSGPPSPQVPMTAEIGRDPGDPDQVDLGKGAGLLAPVRSGGSGSEPVDGRRLQPVRAPPCVG